MMKIDVIDYNEKQLAALSAGQVQQVISAQKKKRAMEVAMRKKLSEKRAELIENGMLHSDLWQTEKETIVHAYQEDLQELREGLLLYLHYAVKPPEAEIISAPYRLDYSLSVTERYLQVKEYYDTEYTDDWARFEAFQNDQYAVTYLGEMYYTLYDVYRYEYEGGDGGMEAPNG
jgi:hypothetical protein